MVGTRGKGEISTGSNHLGFRCVKPPVSHRQLDKALDEATAKGWTVVSMRS
jgi:hypothetical protein